MNPTDPLQCDVCIVGSGPAGSTVASALADSGLRVVVLESGLAARDPDADALNAVESVGWPRQPDQWLVRNRVVGGSSHTWWGRTRPFDPVDLAARSWVPHSGWPLAHDDLARWFEQAAEVLGVPSGPFRDAGDPGAGFAVTPIDWRYSRDRARSREPMRIGRHLSGRLGPTAVLVSGRTAVALRTTPDGRAIDSVEFADRDGSRGIIHARTVVLGTGGIENARLLLASGLGGATTGRFLMDHPRGTVARFEPADGADLLRRFGWTASGAALRVRGLALTPEVQREEGLLNCAAWPEAVPAEDDPVAAAGRLLRGTSTQHLADTGVLVRALPLVAVAATRRLRHARLDLHRFSRVTLEAMSEQAPDPASRVTLSDRVDAFGVPLPRIDWRVGEQEARTLRRTAHHVAAELTRLGLPVPTLEPWVLDGGMPPRDWVDIAHPTGTTRMARTPEAGVVDVDCQVHGVRGLFVAGSSVFPTAGHANPTLTIVALALRLGAHLRLTVSGPITPAMAVPETESAGTTADAVLRQSGVLRTGAPAS